MHYAATTYAKVSQFAQSPRELEASVLMKAAVRLQTIKENWAERAGELDEALLYNRKLWTVLVTAVTEPESQLPAQIKQNIVNLGMFIFKRTLDLGSEPVPEKLTVLININREIAAGLRMQPAA